MRLECADGKVRNFRISGYSLVGGWYEAMCTHCNERFGVHDTKILKPEFLRHTCPAKPDRGWIIACNDPNAIT